MKKATFCVICTEENEVEVSDNQIICQVCGSPISDGILERDERILELEKKIPTENEYEVGLQVKVKETEEIMLSIKATSREEAIEKAKKLYEDGDIDYSDFTSFGDRETTLQENTSSWFIEKSKKDKEC